MYGVLAFAHTYIHMFIIAFRYAVQRFLLTMHEDAPVTFSEDEQTTERERSVRAEICCDVWRFATFSEI